MDNNIKDWLENKRIKDNLKIKIKEYCIENKFNPSFICKKLQKIASIFTCIKCSRRYLCNTHDEDIKRYPLFLLKYYFNLIYRLKKYKGKNMKNSYLIKKKDGSYEIKADLSVPQFDFNSILEIHELKEEYEIIIKLTDIKTEKNFDLPKWVTTNSFHEDIFLENIKGEKELSKYITENFKAGQSVYKLGQRKKPVIGIKLKEKKSSKKSNNKPKTKTGFICQYCGRDGFKTERGKKKHEGFCKKK